MNKEYLNEERYQKFKKKIQLGATLILVIGLMIGGALIATGITNLKKANYKYSDESKSNISAQLEQEKQNLENRKSELKSKGIESSMNYEDEEAYDLYVITKALDPSFSYCSFDQYKNNSLTSKYCSLKNQLEDNYSSFDESQKTIPFFMIGGFIILATTMISLSLFINSKGREIGAFKAQQVMPIAKEGMEEMTPTFAKTAKELTKEVAPVYGEVAKEITKGVKEALSENNNSDEQDKSYPN